MRNTLEQELPKIWEAELQAAARRELEEVRTQMGLAIRKSSGTQVMGFLREAMRGASSGLRVDETRLRAIVDAIKDPTAKKLVHASGNLILKAQSELPEIPRGYMDVYLASQAKRITQNLS